MNRYRYLFTHLRTVPCTVPDRTGYSRLLRGLSAVIAVCCGTFLTSCFTVGPDHCKPDTSAQVGGDWKWQPAEPRDDHPKGCWWEVFNDPVLNRLETTAANNNQEIKAALARVEQAASEAHLSKTSLVPEIGFQGKVNRERSSANLPTPIPTDIPVGHFNTFSPVFTLNYEVDLWGRIRRGMESARANFDSAVADAENLGLSLTAEVAANYFQLRGLDAESAAVKEVLVLRRESTALIQQRFDTGAISEVDLARSKTEVATTRAELARIERQRAEILDQIALLCGQPANTFKLGECARLSGSPPVIPAGLPLCVIERRPDVATAERIVAARNAKIGVATADYFPKVTLIGNAGYLSKDIDVLFASGSRVWSIGPTVTLPLTGIAAVKLNVEKARAAREEAIANYRQAVLTAIKDVETSLTQIRQTGKQLSAQREALAEAKNAARLIRQSYHQGASGFLELLDAERTSLTLERQTALLQAEEYIATTRLIKAIGGEW